MTQRRCIRDEQLIPGAIVVYTLRPDQRPRHPEKEWRGKVLCVYPAIQRIHVASLGEGYEDCDEDVWFEQVVRIETPNDTVSHPVPFSGDIRDVYALFPGREKELHQ
jgi:hypothetical protein